MKIARRTPIANPDRPVRSDESGFGAIEMAVVLIILGLMIAVTMPGLRGYQATSAMQTTARQFVSDLRAAQARAVGQRVKVDVLFTVSSGAVTGYTVQQGSTVLQTVTLSSAVRATSSWPGNDIAFTTDGAVTGPGSTPALCVGNTQGLTTTVSITLATGRAVTASGTGSC